MTSLLKTSIKVGIFAVVMLLVTAGLFAVFGQYRGNAENKYSAVFRDVSSLKSGDAVKVAGVRVGTVNRVSLQPDNTVTVGFEVRFSNTDFARRTLRTVSFTTA